VSADEWFEEHPNPMLGTRADVTDGHNRPADGGNRVADPDDWDEDGHQQHKDGVAMGYINEDGTQREPDEPDWDQRAEEEHSFRYHRGGQCDCPEPPRLISLPHDFPRIVVLCGSTRFYDAFQQANYDLTMKGAIVLSVGFYPHSKAEHGHGEGVGHDSAEKTALDELHKRKIDLADEVLVVSDESGYFGSSTAGEIAYANETGKPVGYLNKAAFDRADTLGLIVEAPF